MHEQFAVSPELALAVVLTTVVMYLAFIALVRLFGQRSLASMSSFDIGCVVALGAVLGRTVLLKNPTLMIGLVALATFFAMQALLGVVRQVGVVDRLLNRPPVLLVRNGVLLVENMRTFRVVEAEVRQAVRHAGLHGLEDVGVLVLERNGTLSVLDRARPVDPWLLDDVTGAAPDGRGPRAR